MQELANAINGQTREVSTWIDDQALHQKNQISLRLYSEAIKWRTAAKLEGYDDEGRKQEQRPVIQLPTHLFDFHLVHTLQPSLLQPSTTLQSRWTPTSPLTKQAPDGAARRPTACSRSIKSDREPLSGTSHSGSKPPASKRHSTQLSTLCGRLWGNKMLGRSTTNNEQMCTCTSKTNNSISSEQPETTTKRKMEQETTTESDLRAQPRDSTPDDFHHSHNNAKLATTHREDKLHAQHDIKRQTEQHGNRFKGWTSRPLPPGGNIQYSGQLITFKNAVQVEFDQRIWCAWAKFTSHRQKSTSWKYPLRDRLNPFNVTATPSLFNARGTWKMTVDMKQSFQTTERRMMIIIMQKRRKPGNCLAAAHAAIVDEIADVDTHDSDSEPEEDTTEPNPQNLNEQEESGHAASTTKDAGHNWSAPAISTK